MKILRPKWGLWIGFTEYTAAIIFAYRWKGEWRHKKVRLA